MTLELTRGLAPDVAIGAMLLTATGPGVAPGIRYAGWRILPHLSAPESWGLPVDHGLVVEISFSGSAVGREHAADRAAADHPEELRPLSVRLQCVFERGLKGQGNANGWVFEPNLRLGYEVSKKLDASLEYYGTLAGKQVHEIYPGVDWKISEHLLCNLGIGLD